MRIARSRWAGAAVVLAVAFPWCAAGQGPSAANPLDEVAWLIGSWAVPPEVVATQPELAGHIVHDYAWTVGVNAMRVRESFRAGAAEESEVDGIVYWDPATRRIEFVAVGGHGREQGRLFRGEYRLLAGGEVERIYDVFYRTPADMPGEELGGNSRRYREVYRLEEGRIFATLDWWRDGAWRPFGPGTYELVRVAT